MKKALTLAVVLAMAVMLGACSYSLDTLRYAGNTDKEVQAVTCEVISIVEEVAPEPAAAPVTITKIREPIMFPFDSSEITDAEMVKVDKIAQLMKDYPDTYISINGWASSEGPEDYNLNLSGERSTAVKSALIEKGISEDRIDTVAKGETGLFGDLLKLNRRAIVLDVE